MVSSTPRSSATDSSGGGLSSVRDRYTDDEIASYYETGYWRPETMFDLVAAQAGTRPDKAFVFDSTTSLTYRDLLDQAGCVAAGLRALGVGTGDRVAVQLPNWTELILASTAIGFLGAIIVPIMPIYRDDEVGFVLRHAGVKAAITCERFKGFDHLDMFRRLRPECPGLQALISVRGETSSTDVVPFEQLAATAAPDAAEQRALAPSPDDGFLIVYTSSTTSRPKGCFHTLNTLRASAAAIGSSTRYTEGDVQFGPSPVTHSTGLVTSFMLPLLYGASSHLMESWDPIDGLRRIQQYGCTAAVTATAFLKMLMNAYDPAEHDASSLRLWICAGSPVPGSVVTSSSERFAGCRVLSLYGRSENFLTTMCTVEDPPDRSSTSDGSALDGASVQVVDESGEQLPRGEQGDLAYRGPSHMIEYFRDDEQTAALFTPAGYSRSGDLGVMDADGFVRVTGRLKDIVIRGGLNISARELEELLDEHPSVAGVAVVGMPDVRLGEKVCAYVVPAAGTRPVLEELTDYLRARRISTSKLPERLELIDQLPMTATGKVRKHVLRSDIDAKLRAVSG